MNETNSGHGYNPSRNESIVSQYCAKYQSGRGALIPYAPSVVLIARMDGVPQCAAFFSEVIGEKISRKPVNDILKKVEGGDIVVTREQLTREAQSHPRSAKFAEVCPWVLDPRGKRKPTTEHPSKLNKGTTSSIPVAAVGALYGDEVPPSSVPGSVAETKPNNAVTLIRAKMAESEAKRAAGKIIDEMSPELAKGIAAAKAALSYKT